MREQERERAVSVGGAWRTVGGLVGLIALLTIMVWAQSNFQEDDAEANQVLSDSAFGYADPEGKRVLAPVDTSLARSMRRFSKAVVVPGKVVDVHFVEARHAADGLGARQEPATFDHTAGAVFTSRQALPDGGDVLVATDRFLAGRKVVSVTPLDRQECSAAVRSALETHAGRPAAWCRDLAALDGGGRLSLARFSPRSGEQRLTLVYTGTGGPAFYDHSVDVGPAAWKDETSAEAVVAAQYQPLFAFRTDAGVEVALRTCKAEGTTMHLYRQDGDALTPSLSTAWLR